MVVNIFLKCNPGLNCSIILLFHASCFMLMIRNLLTSECEQCGFHWRFISQGRDFTWYTPKLTTYSFHQTFLSFIVSLLLCDHWKFFLCIFSDTLPSFLSLVSSSISLGILNSIINQSHSTWTSFLLLSLTSMFLYPNPPWHLSKLRTL